MRYWKKFSFTNCQNRPLPLRYFEDVTDSNEGEMRAYTVAASMFPFEAVSAVGPGKTTQAQIIAGCVTPAGAGPLSRIARSSAAASAAMGEGRGPGV